jgi:hypothetical protein
MLDPGELADHPAARARNIGEKVEEDDPRIESEYYHQDQRCIKTYQSCIFEK